MLLKSALTQEVQDVVLSIMEGLSCPRSLTVAILLRHGEWDQIVQLRTDPKHYSSSESYSDAAAASGLLKKYQDVALTIDRETLTREKWWWAEKECYKTNERLSPFLDNGIPSWCTVQSGEAILSFIEKARKELCRLIGSRPPTSFDGRFGPGATMSDKSQISTIPDKMSSLPTMTPNAWIHLRSWSECGWSRAQASLGMSIVPVKGNLYFSVPKDATINRGCGMEPSLNVFYQLGLGRCMKKRLQERGLDLRDGKTLHSSMAKRASITGEFSTIDLTSASDTNATALVKLLVSPSWFSMLDSLRSPMTSIGGKWVYLEKFSSMGNGFTFELETAMFAAIAYTACNGEVTYGEDFSVYGDDIIVPTRFTDNVIEALKFFGFTPNIKKTFKEGYFRESCGGDFFNGVGVRPHSLEKDPNEPQKLISLANGIRRMARQDGAPDFRWRNLRTAWFKCLDLLPVTIKRCRGPEALGDIVIHDSPEFWDTRWRAGIRYLKCYRPAQFRVIGWEGFSYEVQMASALYGVTLTPKPCTNGRIVTAYAARSDSVLDPRGVIPRDRVTGYKVGWVAYS